MQERRILMEWRVSTDSHFIHTGSLLLTTDNQYGYLMHINYAQRSVLNASAEIKCRFIYNQENYIHAFLDNHKVMRINVFPLLS